MINVLQFRTVVAALVAFVAAIVPSFGIDPQIPGYIEKGAELLALVFLRLGIFKAEQAAKASK